MKKQVFLYFLSIFIIIQIAFYISNGREREKEKQGFKSCWSNSRVPGRPTWKHECNDKTFTETINSAIEFFKDTN